MHVAESGYYAWRERPPSFWARVQVELLNRRRWRTRLELPTALFEYLEIFHDRQRRHFALGMLSPVEYELRTPPVA
ncbi:IS3 family transposase [Streptomyces sp. NPDC050287]|uniref:IS3 family transposase n=1 Tax=Streptomyces sp. NPDC050287 TaxID=3365608 RepID=UPI00379672A4